MEDDDVGRPRVALLQRGVEGHISSRRTALYRNLQQLATEAAGIAPEQVTQRRTTRDVRLGRAPARLGLADPLELLLETGLVAVGQRRSRSGADGDGRRVRLAGDGTFQRSFGGWTGRQVQAGLRHVQQVGAAAQTQCPARLFGVAAAAEAGLQGHLGLVHLEGDVVGSAPRVCAAAALVPAAPRETSDGTDRGHAKYLV